MNPLKTIRAKIIHFVEWFVNPTISDAKGPEWYKEHRKQAEDSAKVILDVISRVDTRKSLDNAYIAIQGHWIVYNYPDLRKDMQLKAYEKKQLLKQEEENHRIAKAPHKLFDFINNAVTEVQFKRAETIIALSFEYIQDGDLDSCLYQHVVDRKQALRLHDMNQLTTQII